MSVSLLTNMIAAGMINYALPVAMPGTCRITQAPVINIVPETKPIQYDLTKTVDQLSSLQSGTISPYGLTQDQITAGFRHDQPRLSYQVKYYTLKDPNSGTFCMSYSKIDVNITLQPKIYVAKEYNSGQCGKEIIGHEKKHVIVDRKVINKYAKKMGKAIQQAVNATPVLGPFPEHRFNNIKDSMDRNIESAVSSVELALTNEMNKWQQQVDSHAEYERVSKFCEKQREALMRKKAQQR